MPGQSVLRNQRCVPRFTFCNFPDNSASQNPSVEQVQPSTGELAPSRQDEPATVKSGVVV